MARSTRPRNLTRDGEIVLDTGESAKEYLKEYALRLNISSDEPMSLVPRANLNRIVKDSEYGYAG